jgi:hypothetical protein
MREAAQARFLISHYPVASTDSKTPGPPDRVIRTY